MSEHLWQVVGGEAAGGLLVRSGQALNSPQLSSRLQSGAIVREIARHGDRLNYQKLQGDGPDTGWVSLKAKGKDLLVPTASRPADMKAKPCPFPRKKVKSVQLPGGSEMPMSGLGLQNGRTSAQGEAARQNVYDYLMLGGRHLDCALQYENNKWIGEGVREAIDAGVPREEIFISSKISMVYGLTSVMFAVPKMLKELGIKYVDMLMIHYPANPTEDQEWTQKDLHQDTWKAMDKCRSKGQAREIGVSNFGTQQMQDIMDLNLAPIAANEIEYHPWVPCRHHEVAKWCLANKIAVVGYGSAESFIPRHDGMYALPRVTEVSVFSDLPGEPATDFGWDNMQKPDGTKWSFDKPTLAHWQPAYEKLDEICRSVSKTRVQVILRWTVQHGVCVIPGSANHMEENLDIFDWTLSPDDMAYLDSTPAGLTSYRIPFGPETLI